MEQAAPCLNAELRLATIKLLFCVWADHAGARNLSLVPAAKSNPAVNVLAPVNPLRRVTHGLGKEHPLFGPQLELFGRRLPIAIVKPRRQALRGREQVDVRGNEASRDVVISFLHLRVADTTVGLARSLLVAREIGHEEDIHGRGCCADVEGAECECVLEEVNGFAGKAQPGSAMFKFGEGYGFLKGVVQALGIKLELVRPQVWQKAFSLGTAARCASKSEWKNKLKAEAQRRFPKLPVTLATADALLILEWSMGRKRTDGTNDCAHEGASRTGDARPT